MFGDIFDTDIKEDIKTYTFGSFNVSVSCVAGENQHIEKWVPLVVWRAAEVFGMELVSEHWQSVFRGKRVVELGSGTGLCGILAAQLCQEQTLLTDGSMDSINILKTNIDLNKLQARVSCCVLNWGDVSAALDIQQKYGSFEICIATDVIYEAIAVPQLLTTASLVLMDTGMFYLANHRFRFQHLLETIKVELPNFSFNLIEVRRIGNDVDLFIFKKYRVSNVSLNILSRVLDSSGFT